MDILYQLLSSSNIKIANDLWELLSFLPTNRRLKAELEKPTIDSEEIWFKVLDITCVRKLQYCLQILLDFTNPSYNDTVEINDWCMRFVNKKGLSSVIKIFFVFKIDELKNSFQSKCFSTLIRLLNYFLEELKNIIILFLIY